VVQRDSKHVPRVAAHPPSFVPQPRPVALSASNRRPAGRSRLPARRDASPRPATAAPAVTRPGAARSSRSEHALVRLARTIAGDRRHKVEPFPKVQQ
jgi:hypothetical protein